MDTTSLRALFRYNHWANEQTFAAVSPVPRADFVREVGKGPSSIRSTLTHVVWSEWIWLQRWTGACRLVFQPADFARVPPAFLFPPEDYATVDALQERSRAVATGTSAFLETLDPARLHEVTDYETVTGETWSRPLWRQLYHAVNHSSYHRGQVALLLRQLGHTPAPTDFVAYEE